MYAHATHHWTRAGREDYSGAARARGRAGPRYSEYGLVDLNKPNQMISAFCTAFPRSLLILDDSTVFSVGQNCGDAPCPKCGSGSPNLHFEPGERLGACWGTGRPRAPGQG